ncbi:MAG: CDP-alcohol phosphatidyltransferase family protein [Bacilli bacterium]|nr:CDP-alcohol phosphatidyltransferase family protein [Bacilli bacterium]
MNKFVKQIPNIVTSIRIVGAMVLFFLKPLELAWFIIYGLCGASDFFDGLLARKLNASSVLGSVLDSIADLLFYAAMLVGIFPTTWNNLPLQIWILVFTGIGWQILAYAVCAVKFRRFSSVHTYLNKTNSWFVFALPFFFIGMIPELYLTYSYIGAIFIQIPGLEVLLIHIIAKRYDERNKSIFFVRKNETSGDPLA